jgi:hypothetical protein
VQQSGSSFVQTAQVSSPSDASEREADAVSESVLRGEAYRPRSSAGARIAREVSDAGAGGPEEEQRDCVARNGGCQRPAGIPSAEEIKTYNEECRKETHYSGPDLAPCGYDKPPGAESQDKKADDNKDGDKKVAPAPQAYAGQPLKEEEKKTIAAAIKVTPPATATVAGAPQGLRFVLHDTAATPMAGPPRLAELQHLGRGPLGEGAAAYVPKTDEAVIARPNFFDPKRPTASKFEKAGDVASQPKREAAFRNVWQATKSSERQLALDRALEGTGLTPKEIKDEQNAAKSQLNAGSGTILTTATWAVGEICSKVNASGVESVAASKAQEAKLAAACGVVTPYITARQTRVGSEVNVEILQEAHSACRTTGKLEKLPEIPYTPTQYENVANLYLQAALQAGVFPETTTHFWVDRDFKGHCDPRCFNLTNLYNLVASKAGHAQGSTYGDAPRYGIVWSTHNVWWHTTVCGGPPP